MTDITAPPAKLTRDFGTKADKNHKAILATRDQVAEGFLVMGSLLKACREEKYFTAYGHEKFEHYLGSPELGVSRSMAFGLIQVHELYIEKLDIPTPELVKAGIGKLLVIAPVVEKNPDEWLGKAQAMSRSDLKMEVDEAQGKEPKALIGPITDTMGSESALDAIMPMDGDYVSWVRKQGCIICGLPAEPHHFPTTKGAGGKEVADHVIPLCRSCHEEAHADPQGWMNTYKTKWGNYFFNVILMLWPKAKAIEMKVVEGTFVADETGKSFDVEVTRDDVVPLPKPVKSRKPRRLTEPEKAAKIAAADAFIEAHPEVKAVIEELSSDVDKTPEELLKAEEPKVMEGFGKFSKCHKCGNVMPESELEGGLCVSCRG